MEKMIVTGSDGFIGHYLVERLKRMGYDVIGIDRKSEHDVHELAGLLRAGGVRCVFHLAAQTSVFNKNKEQIFSDNMDAFYYVCDCCKIYNVKLVYASSSTAEPSNLTSLYGLSKNFAERYAAIYNREATGVRLHNVYGKQPRQGTLLHTLLNTGYVTLYNNGDNIRCFTYIDDIVEGLLIACMSGEPLLNCVNNEPMKVSVFAEKVQTLLKAQGKKLDIHLTPQVREYDNPVQSVNESIPTIMIAYKSVDEGLKIVLNE